MPRLSDIPEIRDNSYEFQGEYDTLKHQEVCSYFHYDGHYFTANSFPRVNIPEQY